MAIKKVPAKKADLNSGYDALAKKNRELLALNADLHSQLTTMRESRTISPEEEQAIKTLRSEFDRINKDCIALAEWLGRNKALEIRQGRHVGMTLAEICIMYMAKGLYK